jgi:nucleoside-diphosphate-sugar epimerase
MNLIITGAHGFIASQLIKEFNSKNKIYGIVRKHDKNKPNVYNSVFYYTIDDFFSSRIYTKIDNIWILHLANYMQNDTESLCEYLQNNSLCWVDFIEKANQLFKKVNIINFESYWQYDSKGKFRNTNSYILSKNLITNYLESVKNNFENIVSVVLYDIYSEVDSRPKLLNSLLSYKGKELFLKNGHKEKIFVHVNLVIECVKNILNHKKNGFSRIFLCHQHPRKLKDIIKHISDEYGLQIHVLSSLDLESPDPIYIYTPVESSIIKKLKLTDNLIVDFKFFL